ncbi:MBL fold metallo-hydrolase [Pseudomonas syringae]|uniref:MBL fold metallo-hydrolase n=1 Tax=Pseudomonas syringae TaxID=317 RepID=UPI000CDB9F5B|nr:MBL fold metallo-hydrolase [Pseudomonas syringae]POP65145.1 MBL fold metallo-hydrolase [Pseudomonas syringae]
MRPSNGSAPLYRLAACAIAEPLVNGWSAWWLNVAPLPASLHFAQVQRKVMQLYLDNPALNYQMAIDPALSGNACIGVPPEHGGQVAALLASSESALHDCLGLSEAVHALQQLLLTHGNGQSLEPLYAQIPGPLRGLVELVYDYFNRPSFRTIEALTYRSRYYKPWLQSVRIRQLRHDGDRPFLFSTPHAIEPQDACWQVPFASPRLDALFQLDTRPQPLHALFKRCEADEALQRQLYPLLTQCSPLPRPAQTEVEADTVRYLGHATVLVQTHGVAVLVDPFISAEPLQGGDARVTFQALPEHIDYVLITHAHPDHFSLETLLRLRHRIGCLVVPRSSDFLLGDVSLRLMAQTLGFTHVVELAPLESIGLPDGEIIGVPFLGEHGDLAHAKSAYVIRLGRRQMLFAADSACLDPALYERVREAVGTLETVFMNTETEGAPASYTIEALFPQERDRQPEKNRRCRGSNSGEAIELLKAVGAKRLYNYAMGLEPWFQHVLGPASKPGDARMRDSDALLRDALAAGLESAQRLHGPQLISLGDNPAPPGPIGDYEVTL